jgi:hypothetical protein
MVEPPLLSSEHALETNLVRELANTKVAQAEMEGKLLKAKHLITRLKNQMEAVLNRLQVYAGEASLPHLGTAATQVNVQRSLCIAHARSVDMCTSINASSALVFVCMGRPTLALKAPTLASTPALTPVFVGKRQYATSAGFDSRSWYMQDISAMYSQIIQFLDKISRDHANVHEADNV